MVSINNVLAFFLFLAICIPCTNADAQYKLARIKDTDGYTNIRSEKSTQSGIVAILDTNDLFICDTSPSEWRGVIACTGSQHKEVKGFIYKSRIEFIDTLPEMGQKTILLKVLHHYKRYCIGKSDFNYVDCVYDPVLNIIPGYISKTKDTIVMQKLLENILLEKGSANETLSWTLGNCFASSPDLVSTLVIRVKQKDNRRHLCEGIDRGLDNIFYDDWNKGRKDSYIIAKQRLRTLINVAGLKLTISNIPGE